MNKVNSGKEKLKEFLKEDITKMFEQILDYAQIAVPNTEAFKVLRSKVLRAGNDCIRDVHKRLNDYSVIFTNLHEDIIEVREIKRL